MMTMLSKRENEATLETRKKIKMTKKSGHLRDFPDGIAPETMFYLSVVLAFHVPFKTENRVLENLSKSNLG